MKLNMRFRLLYDPELLFERLGELAASRRRFRRLRGTPAAGLNCYQIGSLELLEHVRSCIRQSSPVVYDVGANAGTWTRLAKAVFPTSRVEAFEPLPSFAPIFRESTSRLGDVTMHQVALGSSSAVIPLHLAGDSSSLLKPGKLLEQVHGIRSTETVDVPVVRLDDYVNQHRLPSPSLIKLDVQGYELEALRGFDTQIREIPFVLAEVSFVPFYEYSPLFSDIAIYLQGHGFVVEAFGADMPLGKPVQQVDVLFRNTRLN